MFYLANDDRSDQKTKFCWDCGETDTPRAQKTCISCNSEMKIRKFLICMRWNPDHFESYEKFFEKDISHGAMLAPIDMFYDKGVLCSIIEWKGHDFLLNVSSPMQGVQVLMLAQRILGLLAYYHRNGICLEEIHPRNFLCHPQTLDILFFDPDIRKVYESQVPEVERNQEIISLAETLLKLTSVEDEEITLLLQAAAEGQFATPYDFGREIEKLLEETKNVRYSENGKNNLAALSDVGLVRNLNEDNWGWLKLKSKADLYVVADGMGGHDRGEVASQMAVDTLCREAKLQIKKKDNYSIEELEDLFENAFQAANNGIKEQSEFVGSDMGTTMVAALIWKEKNQNIALVANVGDSRAYLVRENELHQISKDHSLVAKMVEQNQITAEEARTHPHSNILLRTVGTERDVSIDIFRVGLEKNDLILLCSDGLWGEVEDEDIQSIINKNKDIRTGCRELLRAAHMGGGRDNCTILMCRFP